MPNYRDLTQHIALYFYVYNEKTCVYRAFYISLVILSERASSVKIFIFLLLKLQLLYSFDVVDLQIDKSNQLKEINDVPHQTRQDIMGKLIKASL